MDAILDKPEKKQIVTSSAIRMGKTKMAELVEKQIRTALTMFDEIIGKSEILAIDAFLEKGDLIAGKDHMAEEAGFKIVNHAMESAYFVPLDKIIKSSPAEIKSLVISLADGVFQRLEGCTRIVGYYSRIHNWNKSKIGELKDRHMGNYACLLYTSDAADE